MKPKHSAALAAAFALATTAASQGAILMTITDDGTDLTMRATGSYDNTGLTDIGSGVRGNDAYLAKNYGLYGWEALHSNYAATYIGSLAGIGDAFGATISNINIPFLFNTGAIFGNALVAFGLDSAAPISGTVDNTAVFEGTTLASLGMVAGQSMTVTWGTNTATIQTSPVPEPSAGLLGLVGAGLFLRRRR